MTMTDTPETDGEWNRLACQDHPEFERNLADFARKLERERDATIAQQREEQRLHIQTLNERNELAGYLCRIKLPLSVRFVANLVDVFPGKNVRMKDVDGYLCIFSVNAGVLAHADEKTL
jgi:hypothetical protein